MTPYRHSEYPMPHQAIWLIIVLLLSACAPSLPATPSLAATPVASPTATSVPPTATVEPTSTQSPTPPATATPTSTPSPSSTPTATAVPPTDTPTAVPTATRAPTRPPTNTPAPVAAAPAPACPAWYQAPQPGKGILLIVNDMRNYALFDKLPGQSSPTRLEGAREGEPSRVVLQVEPGQYNFTYSSEASGHDLSVSMSAGEMKMVHVFLRRDGMDYRYWWSWPATAVVSDVYVGTFDIPYGCPGGLPPTPTPAPQCPAWYAAPAPGKAVLAFENRGTEPFDIIAPGTGQLVAKVPRNANNLPGFAAITLVPGHHEFETTTSKRIVVDLAAGSSVVAVHAEIRRLTPDVLPIAGLTPPPGCPGYATPTPPPPPQCPDWFQRPQPGKGMLVVESWIMTRVVAVIATQGLELEFELKRFDGKSADRRVLQLNPGHYEFATQEGGFSADIAEGQTYSVGLAQNPWGKRAATVMSTPPGCQ